MDKKSFGIGLVVASCVWLTSTLVILHVKNNPMVIENCNLSEDDVIDTEFERLMIENRVKAYERGYYSCLQDANPDMYTAYISCMIQIRAVHGDEAFNAIVDSECAKYNFSAEDKEYLCTLLLD